MREFDKSQCEKLQHYALVMVVNTMEDFRKAGKIFNPNVVTGKLEDGWYFEMDFNGRYLDGNSITLNFHQL